LPRAGKADTFCIAQKVSKNASSKKGDCKASFILKSKCFFNRIDLMVLKFERNCDRRTFDFSFTIACFLNGMQSKKKSAANAGRQRSNSSHTAFCITMDMKTTNAQRIIIYRGCKMQS